MNVGIGLGLPPWQMPVGGVGAGVDDLLLESGASDHFILESGVTDVLILE